MVSESTSVWFLEKLSRLIQLLIRGYQVMISPFLPQACRYYPTCSEYARVALQRHGVVKGAPMAAKRILSCHPWCDGGIDHVPKKEEA